MVLGRDDETGNLLRECRDGSLSFESTWLADILDIKVICECSML
jgi:hypothetical protein